MPLPVRHLSFSYITRLFIWHLSELDIWKMKHWCHEIRCRRPINVFAQHQRDNIVIVCALAFWLLAHLAQSTSAQVQPDISTEFCMDTDDKQMMVWFSNLFFLNYCFVCFVSLQVPFPVLQGEGVEYLGRADEAIIAISNYRLHIKFKDSVINVSSRHRQ